MTSCPDRTEEEIQQDSYGSWRAAIDELRRRKEAAEQEQKITDLSPGSSSLYGDLSPFVLYNYTGEQSEANLNISAYNAKVANILGVPVWWLNTKKRDAVVYRKAAAWAAREITGCGWRFLRTMLECRSFVTVQSRHREACKLREIDPEFRAMTDMLRDRLTT